LNAKISYEILLNQSYASSPSLPDEQAVNTEMLKII